MKRSVSGALVAVLCAVTVWAAAPAYPQGPKKIKLTMPVVALSMIPVYLAQANGYFAEDGLDVEMITTNGAGPDIKALIAGDVDFSFTPGDNVMLAYQEGKRTVMVMTGFRRLVINWAMHKDVARARGITETTPLAEKLKALKGLTVGVTQAGALTSHLAMFVIRKAGYVPQQDVHVIPIGSGSTWLAALENRKVDVALTATPVPETAVDRGFAVMFIDNARGEDPSVPEFLMECLITRPDVIEKTPDLVRRMVRALLRANVWALRADPDRIAAALKPFLGQTPPEVLLSGVKTTLPALSRDGRTTERGAQVTQDVLEQAGILKKRVPYAEVANNAFLR
ncbi:MAG: ABC transporter substrate-binding protein [Bacillati bacterium ANGP1]|uniref:ABC transporter substrate-binding protein n=1 Tax=Candidatus Segetimicrobium genomatis TaxID=2569760 RepID=A0A537LU84_9BACT|nr:MAG: ABC transporter substrate-binding protein [Terrabacteria group bacterium ANGP1]